MSEERARLWEAWATTLDEPLWADQLRHELDFLSPTSARDLLLQLLSRGPLLYGAWQDWRDSIRKEQEPAATQRLFAQGRLYLNPDPQFAEHWQRVRENARHFRSRNTYVQVDANLLQSPQPRMSGLAYLQERYGLSGVINLREESQESKEFCLQLGLDYHWIAVEDMQTPQLHQVQHFLEISKLGVHLVHCFAGQGRTGLFVAAYRASRGMPLEQAISCTDSEIFSRGMRDSQRQWLLQNLEG